MKRSIDNALHLFKAPLLQHHGSHGQLRERELGRDKTPPSPSAAGHPQSHSHGHSIFPLHHHHHHSHSHSRSPSQSHLHALFHHGHSHSTTQLQSQSASQFGIQSGSQSTSTSATDPAQTQTQTIRPSFSTGASVTSSSSSPFDSLGVPPPGNRRPSLPHIFNEPASPFQRRLSGRKRRPRSAGSDAGDTEASAGNGSVNPSGNTNGVNGGRLGAAGVMPSLSNVNVNAGTGTITARKLSSKISLRNLFRRTGGDASNSANLSANFGGSEPGSGAASASTSFSTSAPIYNHAFPVHVNARSTTSPTPPEIGRAHV